MEKKRLAKYLAATGVASRRKCEELIFAGRIKVNGKTVLLPQTMVDGTENITIDREKVDNEEKKVYFIFNKPKGTLCSPNKSRRNKLVVDLITGVKERLFTVGRLDKDTTGLLILTNDGDFANQVIHPSSCIQKEYIAKTNFEITDTHLKIIAAGTDVEGTFVKPLKVKKVRKGTVKVVVGEGKKREVRHLIEAAGLKVRELKRVRIGNLVLGDLPTGSWRPMSKKEKQNVFE